MKPVTRQKVNIIIDIIMFVVMVAVAVIGFIIRYVLIPGSERWVKYGRNVDLTCWGLDRHEWGLIHLILGLFLVFLLVLHIIFHWSLIICLIKRLLPNKKARLIAVYTLVILSCIILFAPFYFFPQAGEPIRGQGEGFGRTQLQQYEQIITPQAEDREEEMEEDSDPETKEKLKQETVKEVPQSPESHEEERILEIKGYHTIWELADTYDISADEMKTRLGIPLNVSNNERLGRIRRVYGFTMREVEDCIFALKKSGKN